MDRSELLKEFMSIVSCDEQQANFHLEANNWNLNAALSNFIEEPMGGVEEEVAESGPFNTGGPFQGTQNSALPSTASGSKNTSSSKPRVATLQDLGKEVSEEEEEEERENLFAGGEKSGIFTQNPNAKSPKSTNSLVNDILKKAAEGGRGPAEEPEIPTAIPESFFTGTGYRLGSDDEPTVVVASSASSRPDEPPRAVVRHLTFWRNGFSIDDGPLMSYNDPENEEFLKSINSGRAPLTLLNVRHDQPVDVRVARRLDEDYEPPPKKPAQPFSGSGQRLGGISSVISSSTPGTYPSASSASNESTQRGFELEIDESLPITSIQIRLGDGTRMLARFNHTHTVRDIRNFINASRIGESSRDYVLQASFPPKELKDEMQTISDASLLNAVVVQRYT